MTRTFHFAIFGSLCGCGFGFKALTPDTAFVVDTEIDNDDDANDSDDTVDSNDSNDTGNPNDSDTFVNDGDFSFGGLNPSYGSTFGGTVIEITGTDFDQSAVVYFDDQQASIIGLSGNSIQVTLPASIAEGAVDVTIEQSSGSQTLPGAFAYFEDATGMTSVIGAVSFEEYIGGYWNLTGQTEFASAMATFISPADFHWWEFFTGTMDSCSADSYVYGGNLSGYDIDSSMLSLAGNTNFNMSWNSIDGWFDNGSLTRNDIFNNGYYTLEPVSNGALKGMSIPQFIRASSPSSITQPAITGNIIPSISRNQTLIWNTTGASWVMFIFVIRTEDQMADELRVNCILTDDGNFTIDGSVFSSWPLNRIVDVYFTRVFEQNTVMPHSNGISRIVGQHMLHGAAVSQ